MALIRNMVNYKLKLTIHNHKSQPQRLNCHQYTSDNMETPPQGQETHTPFLIGVAGGRASGKVCIKKNMFNLTIIHIYINLLCTRYKSMMNDEWWSLRTVSEFKFLLLYVLYLVCLCHAPQGEWLLIKSNTAWGPLRPHAHTAISHTCTNPFCHTYTYTYCVSAKGVAR